MKNHKKMITTLLIAGFLAIVLFIGNKNKLHNLFGKEYEVAEIVYRTPIIRAEEVGEKVPWLQIRKDRVMYVDVSGHEWECSATEKLELTKQNFDEYFNMDAYKNGTQEDIFGWVESGMNAARFRSENANAWKFTTLAPSSGMTNLQYLLQQKDGTVYLAMGYEGDSEAGGDKWNEASVFLVMFRLTEKGRSKLE